MPKPFILVTAVALLISGSAFAQSTEKGAGQQVNPGTNSTVGEQGKFGMNNGGDPQTGSGLHGGRTSDTYDWLAKKQESTRDPKTSGVAK